MRGRDARPRVGARARPGRRRNVVAGSGRPSASPRTPEMSASASDVDRVSASIARSIPSRRSSCRRSSFPRTSAWRSSTPSFGPGPGVGTIPRRAPSATAVTSESRASGPEVEDAAGTPAGDSGGVDRALPRHRAGRDEERGLRRPPALAGYGNGESGVRHACGESAALPRNRHPAGHAFAAPGGDRGRPALTLPIAIRSSRIC